MHENAGQGHGADEPTRDLTPRARWEPPEPPFLVGRYEIRREIARHGQGILYEAFDPELERTVAIKIVVARSKGDDGPDRCEREARALAQLQRPHIVPVFDLARTVIDGMPARYFVMEYLRGARPITDFADQHNLPLAARVRLILPLCEAVAAGHGAGILHRDVKPANLLVDLGSVPHVVDFGLASGKRVDAHELLRAQEQDAIVGSLWYLAPEHFERDPDLIDARTDVYSMGVVLYELLTGIMPYPVRGRLPSEVETVIREAAPTPPSRADRRLRGDLEAIILRALAKDPLRRYPSMGELGGELRSWLEASPVRARSSGLSWARDIPRRAAFQAPRAAMVACWVVAAFLGAWVARPALNDLTPISRWFEEGWRAARGWIAPAHKGFQVTRAIVTTDETDFGALGAVQDGVNPADPSTYRSLWGRVLSQLARGHPAAVVLDIAFSEKDHPGDAALIAGIEALRRADCRVVSVLPEWPAATGPAPRIDRDVQSRCLMGGTTGKLSRDEPWRLDLAVQQPGMEHATPSIALAAYAAARRPDGEFAFEISAARSAIAIESWAASPSVVHAATAEDSVPVTFVRRDAGHPESGILRDAWVAHLAIPVPDDGAFERATIDVVELFSMPPIALDGVFNGRIVVVANARGDEDRHQHPDGRTLVGYQAHMAAVEALYHNQVVRHATETQDVVAASTGALLGLLGASPAFSGLRRRLGLICVLGAVIILASLGAYSLADVFVSPVPALVAAVLASEFGAVAAGVRRVRGVGFQRRPGGVG